MTRALLSFVICALCVGLGLWSAQVQAQNHARAAKLDESKRRCDLIEAGNEAKRYQIEVRVGKIRRDDSRGNSDDLVGEEWPER